jgi:tRNA pseudouridine38-40 synthase
MAKPAKRRLALLVAYDGAAFAGWQMQPGRRTVQESLGNALIELGLPPVVQGASRTDKGVHARAMVVSIPTRSSLPVNALRAQLRLRLPREIRVRAVAEVPEQFHAQFSSVGKRYRYQLWLPRDPAAGQPLRLAWGLPDALCPEATLLRLDLRRLQAALSAMVGRRTFRGAMHTSGREGLCDLTEARVLRHVESIAGRRLVLAFSSDRFGKYMVRTLVGIAVRAALGQLAPSQLAQHLDDEVPLGELVAPPQGLTLWKVHYPPGRDPFPWIGRDD